MYYLRQKRSYYFHKTDTAQCNKNIMQGKDFHQMGKSTYIFTKMYLPFYTKS